MKIAVKDYQLGEICLRYLFDQEEGHVSMVLLPKGMESCYEERRQELISRGARGPAWEPGNLCHLSLSHHPQGNGAGGTLKYGISEKMLKYKEQRVIPTETGQKIVTILEAEEGYQAEHIVTYTEGECGIEVETVFWNHTDQTVTLKLLTSFTLDNLSPFQRDDAPYKLYFHRFRGGWSLEGKHVEDSIEDLNLESSWTRAFPESERYGGLGSHPVKRWFPFGCVEDREKKVFWAAQVGINSSWQMELSRDGDCYSFSGGMADSEFGGWQKNVETGACFRAPKAYISVGKESLWDTCQKLTGMFHKYVDRQPKIEQTLPVIFNEWCMSWGKPEESTLIRLADKLKETSAAYLVIDAGWSRQPEGVTDPQEGNGDWEVDEKQFPKGLKYVSEELKERGIRTGIWMEFEVTTKGAKVHGKDWDDLHLKSGGNLIQTGRIRRFWDFRKKETVEYLQEKVIDFLCENEISYLKVDYNGSIGAGCDGMESPGEGLRAQMAAVLSFFQEIRRQLPELVIENCASGGHRLEPSMMGVTAMSSFSDAHECREIPYIAANLHALILPRQSQIWAVILPELSIQEIRYRLTSTMLGRMCLSGDVTALLPEQWEEVKRACSFYEEVKDVIKYGRSFLVRKSTDNQHHLKGSQMLLRVWDGKLLAVAHSFGEEIQNLEEELPKGEWKEAASFGDEFLIRKEGNHLIFSPEKQWQAQAVLYVK